jgi:hypothetical protein
MHRITISLEGAVTVTESRDLDDSEALPLFVKVKALLEGDAPLAKRRKRRNAADGVEPDNSPSEELSS